MLLMWFLRWVMFIPTLMLVLMEVLTIFQVPFGIRIILEKLLILLATEMLREKTETLHYTNLENL